jgi:hypothetical protein
MEVGAVQAANGIPNLMGALLQATMQQSMELATQQIAVSLSLQAGESVLGGAGGNVDIYA